MSFERSAVLTVATVLVVTAAFALFQAVAVGQPWHRRLDRFGPGARGLARVAGLGGLVLAWAGLARAWGWTEAALVTALALVFVASAFVPLAAVAPRLAWGLALAAPPLAGGLLLVAQVLS